MKIERKYERTGVMHFSYRVEQYGYEEGHYLCVVDVIDGTGAALTKVLGRFTDENEAKSALHEYGEDLDETTHEYYGAMFDRLGSWQT